MTPEQKKDEQERLRSRLTEEVNDLIGYLYAESSANTYVMVNEMTLEVDSVSSELKRREGWSYFRALHLMTGNGRVFAPDVEAIEAVVQLFLPDDDVRELTERLCATIRRVLDREKPADLHAYRIGIGTKGSVICYKEDLEAAPDDAGDEAETEDYDDEAESYEPVPARRYVHRRGAGYELDLFQITRLVLDHAGPLLRG